MEVFMTTNKDSTLLKKLADAEVPTHWVSFTRAEAQRLGIFQEDALSEDDAMDSALDRVAEYIDTM
jgi:hypothetical protein